MQGWFVSAANQRVRFLEASRQRITEAAEDLKVLHQQPWQLASLRSVSRICHQLAGSSGFFDVPQFSRAASACERLALDLLQKSSDLTRADVELLQKELVGLTSVLDAIQSGAATELESSAQPEPALKNMVLICSEPRLSIQIAAAFEAVPYVVHSYRGIEGALGHINSQPADVLLIVNAGNVAAARTLIAKYRESSESKPVLLLSKDDDFADRLELIKAGIDGVFEAPFNFESILARLSELNSRETTFSYRVLTVEDDPVQSEVITSTLQSAGFMVLPLQSHHGFEEAVISFKPDLMLLDVDLGEVSGFDLAKYVRQIDRLSGIPIIFLTTRNQLSSFTEGARVGGDEYLVKPASTQYLVASITARIERYRAMANLLERDGLTRLYNYSSFLTRCQHALSAPGALKSWIITFDIDGLGEINNKLGLVAGDRAIAAASKIIRSVFRQTDLLGRTDGGEISVFIQNMPESVVIEASKMVLSQAEQLELFAEGSTLHLSLGVGIAPPEKVVKAVDGLKCARTAMRAAKVNGRSSIFFSPMQAPTA